MSEKMSKDNVISVGSETSDKDSTASSRISDSEDSPTEGASTGSKLSDTDIGTSTAGRKNSASNAKNSAAYRETSITEAKETSAGRKTSATKDEISVADKDTSAAKGEISVADKETSATKVEKKAFDRTISFADSLKSDATESQKKKKRRGSIFGHFLKSTGGKKKSKDRPRRKSSVSLAFAFLEKELNFGSVFDDSKSVGELLVVPSRKELSPGMAAIFIVSTTTGYAMTTLPHALKESSWFGVFLIILFCVNLCYSGLCNGWSWVIMEERWPEYQEDTMVPFQDMAEKAVGKWMKYVVAIFVDLTLLAMSGVYILSIGVSVENIVHRYIGFCPTLIVTAVILLPFMWFRSYKDIKFIGVLDVLLSLLWAFLVILGMFLGKENRVYRTYNTASYESLALAFAGFSFAYGGGAVFPSIMADMKDRGKFTQASMTAGLIVLLLYAIPPILVYAAYGDDTPKTLSFPFWKNAELPFLGVTVEVVFFVQLMTTFVVSIMPTMQSFEHLFGCPQKFGLKRVLVRSAILLFLLLLVLGVPDLQRMAGVLGATTMTLITFVLPPLFYVCLVYQKDSQTMNKRTVSKKEWLLVGEMILIGVVICIVSTYVAMKEAIESSDNRTPCYINMSSS